MKRLSIAVELALTLMAAGHGRHPSQRQVGTASGAVAGALLGATLTGGSTGATVVGAAVGAVVGNELGKTWNADARRQAGLIAW